MSLEDEIAAYEATVARLAPARFIPTDWTLLDEGVPEHPYLLPPWLPERGRVWLFGPAASAKTLWAQHVSARLTLEGREVVFVSQENPLAEDLRRWSRLRFDRDRLVLLHDQGVDVAQRDHVETLAELARGTALVVLDTLSACWSGDENSNEDVARLDREALQPLVRETGAAVLVVDHTGHPAQFVNRDGVNAGRGASSKAQKADVVLVSKPGVGGVFGLHQPKNRFGGRTAAPARFRVVDTDDDMLDLERLAEAGDEAVLEVAERMVGAIATAGRLSTRALRAAVPASRDRQAAAMDVLRDEQPPRVICGEGTIDGRRAKVWEPAGQQAIGGTA